MCTRIYIQFRALLVKAKDSKNKQNPVFVVDFFLSLFVFFFFCLLLILVVVVVVAAMVSFVVVVAFILL